IADSHATVISATFAGEEVQTLEVGGLKEYVAAPLAQQERLIERLLRGGNVGGRGHASRRLVVENVVRRVFEPGAHVLALKGPGAPDRQVLGVDDVLKGGQKAASVQVSGVEKARRAVAQVAADAKVVLPLVRLANAQ